MPLFLFEDITFCLFYFYCYNLNIQKFVNICEISDFLLKQNINQIIVKDMIKVETHKTINTIGCGVFTKKFMIENDLEIPEQLNMKNINSINDLENLL